MQSVLVISATLNGHYISRHASSTISFLSVAKDSKDEKRCKLKGVANFFHTFKLSCHKITCTLIAQLILRLKIEPRRFKSSG